MKITADLIESHIVREKNNVLEFLLLKRSPNEIYPGLWQMVTGKIKKNEKAFEAALREIKEETSLTPVSFWVVPYTNSFYSHEKNEMCLVPVFVAQVDPLCNVILSGEHTEFIWTSFEETTRLLAWQGQRKSVETINEYFTKEKNNLEFVKLPIE